MQPWVRVSKYAAHGADTLVRQDGHFVGDHFVTATDSGGRAWKAFGSADRQYAVRVLDGEGHLRLSVALDDIAANAPDATMDSFILDPDRERLYVATSGQCPVHVVQAIDLARGTVAGRLELEDAHPRAGGGGSAAPFLRVSPEGRVVAIQGDTILELTADLEERRRVRLDGFTPRSVESLPAGDLVARGSFTDRETLRVVGDAEGQRLVAHTGQEGRRGPDGGYYFLEGWGQTVCRFDPATGSCRHISPPESLAAIWPRADGSFLAHVERSQYRPDSESDFILCDAQGQLLDRFHFTRSHVVRQVEMSDDGRSALVLTGGSLYRIDLDRPPVARLFACSRAGEGSSGQMLHSGREFSIAVPLVDGRILVADREQCSLVSGQGELLKTWSSWQEARAEQGATLPRLGAAWEEKVDDFLRSSFERERFVTWGEPAVPSPGELTGLAEATRAAGTKKLFEGSAGSRSPDEVPFPTSRDLSMRLEPNRVVVTHGAQTLAELGADFYIDHHFRDAMALDLGSTPYIVAGTEEGDVWLARVDCSQGRLAAQRYPLGSPVRYVGLCGSQVVAAGDDGSLLTLDLPLEPGEVALAGGQKASVRAPGTAVTWPASQPAGIRESPTEVVIGGIRLPKRLS